MPKRIAQMVTGEGCQIAMGTPACLAPWPEPFSSCSCRLRSWFSCSRVSSELGRLGSMCRMGRLYIIPLGLHLALPLLFVEAGFVLHRRLGPQVAIDNRNHEQRGHRREHQAADDGPSEGR